MTTNTTNILITVQFPENLFEQIRQVSPALRIITHQAQAPEDIPVDVWNKIEVLYTDRILPLPPSVPNLRWVQSHFAGIDMIAGHPLLQQRDIHVTTLSGAAASQVAEYSLMMMLALGRKMPELVLAQQKADWPRDRWDRFKPTEIRGSTVGLVGYGSIGREIARNVISLGGRIVAVKRDVKHPGDRGYMPDNLGDPKGDLFFRLARPLGSLQTHGNSRQHRWVGRVWQYRARNRPKRYHPGWADCCHQAGCQTPGGPGLYARQFG